MKGPCAKAQVFCDLHALNGMIYRGENWCEHPQSSCPRAPGEDYTKCQTICRQVGHAEQQALKLAGANALGATAVLSGHMETRAELAEQAYVSAAEERDMLRTHRDELLAALEARDAEIAALSAKNLLLRELLAWLDWQGGLGFDKHDRIQNALEVTGRVTDQEPTPQPPPFPWSEPQKIARQIRGDGGSTAAPGTCKACPAEIPATRVRLLGHTAMCDACEEEYQAWRLQRSKEKE